MAEQLFIYLFIHSFTHSFAHTRIHCSLSVWWKHRAMRTAQSRVVSAVAEAAQGPREHGGDPQASWVRLMELLEGMRPLSSPADR